jgi:hypothetical protein
MIFGHSLPSKLFPFIVAHRDTLAQKRVSTQYPPKSFRLMTSHGDEHPQLMLPTGEGGELPRLLSIPLRCYPQ